MLRGSDIRLKSFSREPHAECGLTDCNQVIEALETAETLIMISAVWLLPNFCGAGQPQNGILR
jgi:hypothetical protein